MTPDEALGAVGLRVRYTGMGRTADGSLFAVHIPVPGGSTYGIVLFDGHDLTATVGLEQLAVIPGPATAVPMPLFPTVRA